MFWQVYLSLMLMYKAAGNIETAKIRLGRAKWFLIVTKFI
jgi:hypothetical protein